MKKTLQFAEEWGNEILISSFCFGIIVVYACAMADMTWALHFFGVR